MRRQWVSGAVTAQFTYGPMRISQRRTVTSYYGYDAVGSVRQLTDNTGTITDTYAYDAFGNTVAQTGSTVNEFQYRGEQYDAPLQMYYLRARFYRPQTGRFLTQDKYEPSCGTPWRSEGAYEYSAVDPVDRMDPSGENSLLEGTILEEDPLEKVFRGTVMLAISASIVCVVELTGSILGSEVAGLLGGFDFTLEKEPGLNCFFMAKRNSTKWTCIARCNVNAPWNVPGTPGFFEATGQGNSEPAACKAAMDNVVMLPPPGTNGCRHPHCIRCWRR